MNAAHTSSDTYRVLRQLGSRVDSTHAAIRGPSELVVVHRFPRADGKSAEILRVAQSLAKNPHPNVSRVQHIDADGDELFVATEFVDGLTLGDLLAAATSKRLNDHGPVLPPAVFVRIVLDVLSGLQNIHGLQGDANESLGLLHSAVCPTNIIVGKDGIARLVLALRPPVKVTPTSEALCYSAPEVLEDETTATPRSDLYSCGVVLWEGLQGKRLFTDTQPSQLLTRQRSAEIPWTAPPASIIARLGAVVLRALGFDPAMRFRSAAEFASSLRRAAGKEIATGSAVAQRIVELAGERIRARREALQQQPAMKVNDARTNVESPRPVPVVTQSPTVKAAVIAKSIPPPLPTAARSLPPPTAAKSIPPPLPTTTKVRSPQSDPRVVPAAAVAPKSDPRLAQAPPARPPVPKSDPKVAQAPPARAPVPKSDPKVAQAPPAPPPPPPVPKSDPKLATVRPPVPKSDNRLPAAAARRPVLKTPPVEMPVQAPAQTAAPKLEPLLVTSVLGTSTSQLKPLLVSVPPPPPAAPDPVETAQRDEAATPLGPIYADAARAVPPVALFDMNKPSPAEAFAPAQAPGREEPGLTQWNVEPSVPLVGSRTEPLPIVETVPMVTTRMPVVAAVAPVSPTPAEAPSFGGGAPIQWPGQPTAQPSTDEEPAFRKPFPIKRAVIALIAVALAATVLLVFVGSKPAPKVTSPIPSQTAAATTATPPENVAPPPIETRSPPDPAVDPTVGSTAVAPTSPPDPATAMTSAPPAATGPTTAPPPDPPALPVTPPAPTPRKKTPTPYEPLGI